MGNSSSKTIDLRADDLAEPFPTIFEHKNQDGLVADLAMRHAGRIGAYIDTRGPTAVLQDDLAGGTVPPIPQSARIVTKLVEGTKNGKWTVDMTNMDALHVYLMGWKWIASLEGIGYPLQPCLHEWVAGTRVDMALDKVLWGEESVAWMRAILNAVSAARRIRKDP